MNNLEKFTTQLSKLNIHRANLQTILSYPVRFSTDILFFSLVSFTFLAFLLCFFYLKIHILIHIQLCGWKSDKKIFTRPISEKKTTFFRSNYWRCSARKGILRNFAKFTGKHLYQSLLYLAFDSIT